MGPETVFDLASLTKPLTTHLWCLRLASEGRLDLEAPIGRWLRDLHPALAACPLWRLLNHTTGLPAHREYYAGLGPRVLQTGRHASALIALRRMLHSIEPEQPCGAGEIYSDLGFLLLEEVCERVDGPLRDRWSSLPGHGPDALRFRLLPAEPDATYAATELCPWRGRLLMGEVHDDNCWTMGGVAGHAGLFGSLGAVHDAGLQWLRAAQGDAAPLDLDPSVVAWSLDRRRAHPRGTRVLGWDTPTPGASTSGSHFGRRSIGHLGFTGTSLWIDPDAEIVVTLLTNRVCPTRSNERLRPFRPALHDAARECFT